MTCRGPRWLAGRNTGRRAVLYFGVGGAGRLGIIPEMDGFLMCLND
jgi:hypothetical protein